MKKIIARLLALTVTFSLTGCEHQHDWAEATCETPKQCRECGATEGETLPHTWEDATYTTPKTCSVCGITEGEPLPEPYFVKNNISFDTLRDMELPTVAAAQKNGVWSEDDAIRVEPGNASYTFGEITCAPSGEAGYVDVTIPYTVTYSKIVYRDYSKNKDESYTIWGSFCSFIIGDYYTGLTVPEEDCAVNPSGHVAHSMEYEWNGNAYSISYSENSVRHDPEYNNWSRDGDIAHYTVENSVDIILTITIPKGYDGAVLSIEREGATEMTAVPGESEIEDSAYFLDKHDADDYYFYRLSDLVDLNVGEE